MPNFSNLEQSCLYTFIIHFHFHSVFNLQNRQYFCMIYIDNSCMHKFLQNSTMQNLEESTCMRCNSCKSIAWFCSVYWTLNESESELWMYIGRIAPILKNLKKWPCCCWISIRPWWTLELLTEPINLIDMVKVVYSKVVFDTCTWDTLN